MTILTPEEAVLVFRKLESEGATVFCVGTLWGWGVSFLGKPKIEGDERGQKVVVSSGDAYLTLQLNLNDTKFWYSEPGELPPAELALMPKEEADSACIAVSLPLRLTPAAWADASEVPDRERLFFIEVKAPEKLR